MSGGYHGQDTIRAGDRCPIQPTGERDFTKLVSINGTRMTFRQAQLAGFLEWEHPVPLGTERSFAIWTPKAEAHNRRTVHTAPPSAPPRRAPRPQYGLTPGE